MKQNILKAWIQEWKLTQSEAADILKVQRSKMSEYLSGKRSIPSYISAHIETLIVLNKTQATSLLKKRLNK